MDPRFQQQQQQQLNGGQIPSSSYQPSSSLSSSMEMNQHDNNNNNMMPTQQQQQDVVDDEFQDAPIPQQQQQQQQQQPQIGIHSNTASIGGSTADHIASSSTTSQQQILYHHQQLYRHKIMVPLLLSDRIIMPSPYVQHNTGTSRFRTAFSRIIIDTYNDVEAWQAVMTEASACDSSIFDKSAMDNYTKLDWVESCYGALLHRFPYSITHIIGVGELLYQQLIAIHDKLIVQQNNTNSSSNRNPMQTHTMKQRSALCHTKLQHLFHVYLGTELDIGITEEDKNDPTRKTPIPMCTWVVELWLLYIRFVQHNVTTTTTPILPQQQQQQQQPSSNDVQQKVIRETVTGAYDTAVSAAGDAHNNHLLWKSYIEYVQSWSTTNGGGSSNHNNITDPMQQQRIQREQMVQLRSIYQRAVIYPMTGLDVLWQEYELFEKQQSEALATALIQELLPKYQQARTVYLERNRVLNTGITSTTTTTSTTGGADALQRGRLATPPVSSSSNADNNNNDENEYQMKLYEEYKLLRIWKMKCSYERTNPTRLSNVELQKRIRSTFAEMICTLTRHPEIWHMWSTWELMHGSSSSSSTTDTSATTTSTTDTKTTVSVDTAEHQLSSAAARAVHVLQLGQEHIPDSTLLVYSEAQIYELYHPNPKTSCAVLEKFIVRSPNTLSFVLYQQLIRRYEGIEPARAVFTRARKTLSSTIPINSSSKNKKSKDTDDSKNLTDAEKLKLETDKVKKKLVDDSGKRKMVTNRLDADIGATPTSSSTVSSGVPVNGSSNSKDAKNIAGPITWHLYAAHAVIEHRQNHAPEVAARVYELGLRKHVSFLTVPPYIQRYAQLLLELNDTMNLRALLTRAVAACEVENKLDALASLWDMTLHFESIGGTGPSSVASIQAIEKRRHDVLFGPDYEDIATGGIVGIGETVLIGPQKSSIAEQLIRDEGYDVCSRIISGLSRTVDVLNVMGLWGSGTSEINGKRNSATKDYQSEFAGGKSDASYQKRLLFEKMTLSGSSPETALTETGVGSKALSARERLAGPGAAVGGTAIMLAIQQSPEWLRPLLLLLPASQSRLPIVAKPPPHLTEMALSTLRQNDLPSERPPDDKVKGVKRLISMDKDGNSSDEDDTGAKKSGYGNTFRVRQRARMIENGMNHL